MTDKLQIHIIQNQPELETIVQEFIQEEFQQNVSFENETTSPVQHRDGGFVDALWQVIQVIAVVEGTLQFSERARRLERVQKLEQAIKKAGKPVYLRIKDKTHDLYQKSADQIMNLLAGDDKENDEEK